MANCDECGEQENMPYKCRHCGGTFCGSHRLPESHNCPGLQQWNDPGPVFDSGFDASVSESESSLRSRLSPDQFLSYFRGNVTYLLLAVMGVVFLIQLAVGPLFGIPSGSPRWNAIFTLDPDHPLYIWTWFTSIFSHGGFTHLLFNGIVLFFFGPIVEQRLGSKKYTALFLVSGLAAGGAQIGLGIVLGNHIGILGASGAIMAVMGVLTVLKPDLRVLLYFIIPVPLWLLTIGYAGISALGMLTGFGGNTAHLAHLAGLIIGLVYGQHVKSKGMSAPNQLQLGGGGPPGPGRGRGPF